MPYILSTIANLIAKAEGLEFAQVHTRLRNPAFKSLLRELPKQGGPTIPSMYDEDELFRARVLLRANEIGQSVAALGPVSLAVSEALARTGYSEPTSYPPSSKVPGAYHFKTGLGNAIRGTSQGEEWVCCIDVRRTIDGTPTVGAHVVWAESVPAQSEVAELSRMMGETYLGRILLPLNDLLTPITVEA